MAMDGCRVFTAKEWCAARGDPTERLRYKSLEKRVESGEVIRIAHGLYAYKGDEWNLDDIDAARLEKARSRLHRELVLPVLGSETEAWDALDRRLLTSMCADGSIVSFPTREGHELHIPEKISQRIVRPPDLDVIMSLIPRWPGIQTHNGLLRSIEPAAPTSELANVYRIVKRRYGELVMAKKVEGVKAPGCRTMFRRLPDDMEGGRMHEEAIKACNRLLKSMLPWMQTMQHRRWRSWSGPKRKYDEEVLSAHTSCMQRALRVGWVKTRKKDSGKAQNVASFTPAGHLALRMLEDYAHFVGQDPEGFES